MDDRDLQEKAISSKLVYDGGLLKVYYDTVALANGHTTWREVIRHPGAVVMVPVDDEGNVYLERQFRYPYNRIVIEVPAGKLEWGEDPDHAARRELKEEIGAEASQWVFMGEMLPTPGYSDELQRVYLAQGLSFGETHPDEDEFLDVFKIPLSEALEMATDGRIQDCKTVAALFKADAIIKRRDANG